MLRTKQKMSKEETIQYLAKNMPDAWNYEMRYNDFVGQWEISPLNPKKRK